MIAGQRRLRQPHRSKQSGGAGAGNTVGVYINGAPGNIIGGARGNVISGNSSVGVYILGSPSTGNQVTGNLIGAGPDGLHSAQSDRRLHRECAGEHHRRTSAAARNVISANTDRGRLHPRRPIRGQPGGAT